jgi:hypothetical protein
MADRRRRRGRGADRIDRDGGARLGARSASDAGEQQRCGAGAGLGAGSRIVAVGPMIGESYGLREVRAISLTGG